jgi:hypothetical protein
MLFFDVNEIITIKITSLGLSAALILSRLQTLVLQDCFGRTARTATTQIEKCKTADVEEEERQVMLKELALYPMLSFADEADDAVPLGLGPQVGFRSLIEGLADDLTTLVLEVFVQESAVRAIEQKYFRNHRILYQDVEAKLAETVKTAEAAVATFNEYLKTRCDLYTESEDQEDEEDADRPETRLSIDVATVQNSGKKLVDSIAGEWAKQAREIALTESLAGTGYQEGYILRKLDEEKLEMWTT